MGNDASPMVPTASGNLCCGIPIGEVINLKIKGGNHNLMSNIPRPSDAAEGRLWKGLEGISAHQDL